MLPTQIDELRVRTREERLVLEEQIGLLELQIKKLKLDQEYGQLQGKWIISKAAGNIMCPNCHKLFFTDISNWA